ncbi:MAG: response regulator, partial [Candidatus Omnitrophica bacterium]|nr:response regulator [Candidatus Omnitrophota bacterium]
EKPDLIISDVLMPHVTGYELVQQLEREAKGGRLIPVIIVTAHPRMKDFFKSWEVAAFFEKPLDTGKLLDTIQSIVHYSR